METMVGRVRTRAPPEKPAGRADQLHFTGA
jgi:hypothetical protein